MQQSNNFKERIVEISSSVKDLIQLTENIYGSVHEKLPGLENDIELTLNEIQILLTHFIDARENQGEKTGETMDEGAKSVTIARVLQGMQDGFTEALHALATKDEMLKTIEIFMAGGEKEQEGISSLLEMIAQIKERLTDIEITSLNAIIYAAHLGSEGRAFGVISDNINSLSSQINAYYADIHENTSALASWNKDFKDTLQKLMQHHNHLSSDYQEKFQEVFKLTLDSLEEVGNLLGDLSGNVEDAVQPVQQLMVSIQAQDIMRQNMENMDKCLQQSLSQVEVEKKGDINDYYARLDYLSFLQQVLSLCINLISNVEDELHSSLSEIQSPLEQISSNLRDISEEGSVLTSFLGSEGGGDGAVKDIFNKTRSFSQMFIEDLEKLKEEMDRFNKLNQSFYQQMEAIEKKISTIKGHISFLRKLKLMTRIELARLQLENDSFGQEIAGIADRVVENVTENEAYIVSVKNKLREELARFETLLQANKTALDKMLETAKTSTEKYDEIENLVTGAVQGLGANCSSLTGEVAAIFEQMEKGQDLFSQIDMIKANMQQLEGEIGKEKSRLLEEHGMEGWQQSNKNFEDLLDNFTCYLERKTLKETFDDVDLDEGSEGGELTLF